VPSALSYADLGIVANPNNMRDFASRMLKAMGQAKNIHFSLDGLRMVQSVLKDNPAGNALGSTNWELRTIWDTPALRAKTTFYLAGKAISANAVAGLP